MITSARTRRLFLVTTRCHRDRANAAHSPIFVALFLMLLALAGGLYAPEAHAQFDRDTPRKTPAKPSTTKEPTQPNRSTPAQPANNTLADEGRALFGAEDAASSQNPGHAWSIMLVTLSGPDAKSLADQALWKVQNVGGLPDAFLQEQSKGVYSVMYGRYPDPADRAAQADLKRVHQIQVGNERPFASAILMPPDGAASVSRSPHDLRNARSIYGSERARYTLAIGYYTRDDMKQATPQQMAEYRKAAEQAVAKLRAEGDEAFFYHGPNGSQVTIGIFGPADHDPVNRPGTESIPLQNARKKHPHYLLNGMGQNQVVNTPSGKRRVLLASRLVEIPE